MYEAHSFERQRIVDRIDQFRPGGDEGRESARCNDARGVLIRGIRFIVRRIGSIV